MKRTTKVVSLWLALLLTIGVLPGQVLAQEASLSDPSQRFQSLDMRTLLPEEQTDTQQDGKEILRAQIADEPSVSFSAAPYTQEYQDWLDLPEEERNGLRPPSPISLNSGSTDSEILRQAAASLPASFDARDEGYLTPVRDQMTTSSCWTFSAMENYSNFFSYQNFLSGNPMDTSLLYSVRHMEYGTAQIPGELSTGEQFNRQPDSGGNQFFASAYLTRGAGPILEEKLSFQDNEPSGPVLAARSHLQQPVEAQLLDYMLFNYQSEAYLETNRDSLIAQIKQTLWDNGSVDVGIMWKPEYYSQANNAYYYPEEEITTNHAVLLVGWDDTFPRGYFDTGTTPDTDGAWIIQNSWGGNWGDNGFFYVSYADRSIYQLCSSVIDASPEVTYNNSYVLDPLGQVGSLGYGSFTAYGANVFEKQPGEEQLTQVTLASSCSTEYEIYVSPTASLDISGLSPVVSGTIPYTGFTTVALPTPVSLTEDFFTVIVKYTTQDYGFPVPVEEGSGAPAFSSFLSPDGVEWEEISSPSIGFLNCNIKAFTTDLSPKATVTFLPPYEGSLIYVYDTEGRAISGNPDGTYSLAQNRDYLFLSATKTFLDGGKDHTGLLCGAFSVGTDDMTVNCADALLEDAQFTSTPFRHGQPFYLADLALTAGTPEAGFARVTCDQLPKFAADYACLLQEGTVLTVADNGSSDTEIISDLLPDACLTQVVKAEPQLLMFSDKSVFHPGGKVTLMVAARNPYTYDLADALPDGTAFTPSAEGLTFTAKGSGVEPETNLPVYFYEATIPANAKSGELEISLQSAETDGYLAGSTSAKITVVDSTAVFPSTKAGASVQIGNVTVTLRADISGASASATVTETGGVYTVELLVDGVPSNDPITVSLPAPASGPDTVLLYTDASGTEKPVQKSVLQGETILAILAGGGTLQVVRRPSPFTDVGAGGWEEKYVAFAYSHGLFLGTTPTTFAPRDVMDRAMLTTVLYRLEGSPAVDLLDSFADVPSDAYYLQAVEWAHKNGIVLGTSPRGFDPHSKVTREQLAAMLFRYAHVLGMDTTSSGDLSRFTDANQVLEYAREAMSFCVDRGIIEGRKADILAPQDGATRAECATMLNRFIQLMVQS